MRGVTAGCYSAPMRSAAKIARFLCVALAAGLLLQAGPPPLSAQSRRTERVVLVTLDGVRWQEVFGGLDLDVLRSTVKDGAVEQSPIYQAYWAPTPDERRRRVMPFLWDTLATSEGSIGGDRSAGSVFSLSNQKRFSYPGYAEIVTGAPHDAAITSNDNRFYPFPTIFEFVKDRLNLTRDQVALFGSWETFNWIGESREGSIAINAGFEAYAHSDSAVRQVSDLQFLVRPVWDGARYDAFTFRLAMAHLATARPRLLHIAFDDTDEWAHQGRYDRVLASLTMLDGFLRELWTWLQADAEYRGRTSLIVTTDHGRGATPADWTRHGEEVSAAGDTWMAAAGPDWPRRGVWRDAPGRASQIAATIAKALGLDYLAATPGADAPLDPLWAPDPQAVVQATSLLGTPLVAPPVAASARALMEAQLAEARAVWQRDPANADATIWLGRRTAYLGRFREAIAIFSDGIARHPDDARFYRHRGHRYLTVRDIDRAIADLEKAATLMQARPDEAEPDGQPNARNIPTSTLYSNTWYHLALAYYLKGDFSHAADLWRNARNATPNADNLVAASYWLYVSLRRAGRTGEAAAALGPIDAALDVIENGSYHSLLLMFKGERAPGALLAAAGTGSAGSAVRYGIGAWYLLNDRATEAMRLWRAMLDEPDWPSFGHLAAEAEVARRR